MKFALLVNKHLKLELYIVNSLKQHHIFIPSMHLSITLYEESSQYLEEGRRYILLHSETFSRFWVNQSLFLLIKLRSKRRRSKYQIYSFWFHPTGSEPTTYRTPDDREYANHYTTDAVGDNTNTKCQILIYILNEC